MLVVSFCMHPTASGIVGGTHVHLCTRGKWRGGKGAVQLLVLSCVISLLVFVHLGCFGVGSDTIQHWLPKLTLKCPCSCSLFAYSVLGLCHSGNGESSRGGACLRPGNPAQGQAPSATFNSSPPGLAHPSAFHPCICSLCQSALQ